MRTFFAVFLSTIFLFEVVCFIGENFSLKIMPEKFRLNYFSGLRIKDPDLGWTAYAGNPRPSPGPKREVCAMAFGDSFTHANEVSDESAWTHILSSKIRCTVENYGVGGYGQDQAYLRYVKLNLNKKRTSTFVIFGIYQEMMRRNLTASWLFYANRKETSLKPFYYYVSNKIVLKQPSMVSGDVRSLKDYHTFDYYHSPFRFEFPYSFSLVRMAWNRFYKKRVTDAVAEERSSIYTNQYALKLEFDILRKIYKDQNDKVGFLIFPTPGQIHENVRPYGMFLSALEDEFQHTCIFDPFDALRNYYEKTNTRLDAEKGHFNERGNTVIAEYLYIAMKNCAEFSPE